ncbi:CBO0543 family protein [Neobacillus mesonae]|uniref:CBO0543 family protein n=1 Tax=Neobacillus mesonae TaxID=1193713 RepID=UPI002E1B12B0|nr:hypothetical protein [Neobacillus mesonae]
MRIEWWILISVYIVTAGLIFFIPKNKIRLAVVAFLFKQMITFIIGLMVYEWGLLEYPVRLFASINRTSFTFEYFSFPMVCAVFNVWFPAHRTKLIQWGYYASFSSVLVIMEVIIEKYTELINYIHWEWYISWLSICLSFFISRLFCVWFFGKGRTKNPQEGL